MEIRFFLISIFAFIWIPGFSFANTVFSKKWNHISLSQVMHSNRFFSISFLCIFIIFNSTYAICSENDSDLLMQSLSVLSGLQQTDDPNLFNQDFSSDKKIGMEEILYSLQMLSGLRNINIQCSEPINISNSPDKFSFALSVDIDSNGNIFLLSSEFAKDIYITRSTDGGKSFPETPPIFDFGVGWEYRYCDLREEDSNLYIAGTLYDVLYGGAEIIYFKSTDNGQTITDPIIISYNDGIPSFGSHLEAYNNVVGIIWHELTVPSIVSLAISEDSGNTFSYRDVNALDALDPEIAIYKNHIFLVYLQEKFMITEREIHFMKSDNLGNTFCAPIILSNALIEKWRPIVKVNDDGIIFVTWGEGFRGTGRIVFVKSIDGGKSFCKPITVSDPNIDSFYPDMQINGKNTVYVQYFCGDRSKQQKSKAYISVSLNAGTSFFKPMEIPNTQYNSEYQGGSFVNSNNITFLHTACASGNYDPWCNPDVYVSTGKIIIGNED